MGFAIIMTWLTVVILSGYGYIHNIVLFVNSLNNIGMLEVFRAIGIVAAPLGIVLGYVG